MFLKPGPFDILVESDGTIERSFEKKIIPFASSMLLKKGLKNNFRSCFFHQVALGAVRKLRKHLGVLSWSAKRLL